MYCLQLRAAAQGLGYLHDAGKQERKVWEELRVQDTSL